MAFKKKEINEMFGTVLVLSALLSTASALDCYGKSFHCVNSTHFMICVDLGGGVSKSIDNYLISCPPPTVCQGTNHFECEFPVPSTPPTTLSNVISETTLPWEEVVVTTNSPPRNTTKEYSEKYLNTERITSAVENEFTTDATVDYTTEFASSINDIIVTETEPIVTESIVYPTISLEHVTQITENIATAVAESITEPPSVEERNNTNNMSGNQNTTGSVSVGFPAIEQAMNNTANGSVSSDGSSNLGIEIEIRNATNVNDTRNVTGPNILEQVTPTPDSLNTETTFEIGTAIDDMLTTDIPVVTESILYDTTASEQKMQTIPENIVTGTAESKTETPLVKQKNDTIDTSVHQITTDNISIESPTTEQAINNTANGSVSSDGSSNLGIEIRNATNVNDTRNVTGPNILEQVTPTPDSLNTETTFESGTAIDDMLTTDIPVVTESILYDTTASEQIMQTIPENIVTGTAESKTETSLVKQKNDTIDTSVHQITTDNISIESPTTEKAITNTVNGSVSSDVSSNLTTETRNTTIVSDTRNVTRPNVLEQVTSTPDSLNTDPSFGIGTAIDDILITDQNILTTDIPVVTMESTLYDTTASKQTIPENIVMGTAESTTETPLVEQKNGTNDESVHQITTDNVSLDSLTTEKAISNTGNGSISSNSATGTRNATIVNNSRNITKPNVLELVTLTPDSLNTETTFEIGTAIDDMLTTDIPIVTESTLYDTTALDQTMQTIPKNIVAGTAELTTETPLVEQKNGINDKSVHQITTENIGLESPTTEKSIFNTENCSISSNLATEKRNATIVNDTRNVTRPNVLEQVTLTPDSLNTETTFEIGTAIDYILTTDKNLLTTDIPVVTEPILYDTTSLEKTMQTIPENIVAGTAEPTTETPLDEQKTGTNDKYVHQITTENIGFESPTTEQAISITENGSISSNLATDTRNATIVNDTQNVTRPNVLEQVTLTPDLLNTETTFEIGTAIDDILTTDKNLLTKDIPVVTASILYDTTALEQAMQTKPKNTVTNTAEATTEAPLVEQKNDTNDKSAHQITPDYINFEFTSTEKAISNTEKGSISSNLATETRNAAIVNDTQNITRPNNLERVTPTPDSLNTETSFGIGTAIDDILTIDKNLLITNKPVVTESILDDTTALEQTMQTIPENIVTFTAESTTETPLVEQKTHTNDKPVHQITTDHISLESPTTEKLITNTVNGSVSSDVSSNLATETRNSTIVSETRNVTNPNVLKQMTSTPDSLNTASFGTGAVIDGIFTTNKDLITTDIPAITESILYDTTALEKNMQTTPKNNVMVPAKSTTETAFTEQKNNITDTTVNEITTDNISLGSPTTEKRITDTVNNIVSTDVSSNLATETETAINDILTMDIIGEDTIPTVTELILYHTSVLEQTVKTITAKTVAQSTKENSLVKEPKDFNNKITIDNINLGSPATEQAITVQLNGTVLSNISTNLATETGNAAVEDENLSSQAISPPDLLIAETSTGTEFPTAIDYTLTTDNQPSTTDIRASAENGVQHAANKNMSDQAKITESIKVENSVGTEQKIITILEKHVPTHPSVSSTTDQTVATESHKLPTFTETVLPHNSVIPKYVEVTPTTIKPIVETSIGTDQPMTEHFPKEANDIYTTEAPFTLVTNTNALSMDAADQVSSKGTGDINASIKKANNIRNDEASAKKNLTTDSTIALTINKTEMSTKEVVSTTMKSFEKITPNSDPDKSTLNGIDPVSYISNQNLMGQQIEITTPMIDNGPTDTLQQVVTNADNMISNSLANTLFNQFNQASKLNKAGVAENDQKVSTIDKTSPDLDKNSNLESSVSYVLTDVKSNDKISSEGIVFTRVNKTLQSKGLDSQSLDLLEKTSEPPRVTETLSPFLTQLKPTIIKDNTGYQENSIVNGQIDVLQPVELTTDVTTGFTVLESVQKIHETLDNFKTTPSESTSQRITGDSDTYLIQPEGNIEATEETIQGNINKGTIYDTSLGNPANNIQIMWKVEANAPKTLEATESSSSYKSIESKIIPKTEKTMFTTDTIRPTSDLTGTDNIQITTEPYQSRTPKHKELGTQENAEKTAMDINSVLKTGIPFYNNPTEETAEGVVLPPNQLLFEKDANHISLNTNLHVTPKPGVNQDSKNTSESKSSISGITHLENNFTTSPNLKNLSHSSGTGVNRSSLTHDYTNGGNMQSDLKSEDKNITNNTSAGGIQKQQTKHITAQTSTKPNHPSLVSSVTEDPRKQVPKNPPVDYSCINGIRGRYSDKDDCRKFYICIGNNQPIVGMCPVNTVFSDIKKLCTKNMSHCIRENQFKCPSAGRFSDFINDNVYYICVSHRDHLYRFKFQCQKGFTLNKTTISCLENKEIESNESVSISSDLSDDGGSGKVGSSSSSISSSSSGSSSSRSSGSSSSDSDSSSSNNSSKNKKKETKEEPEDQEEDDEVFECEKEGKFPVRNDCRRYYLCKRTKKSQYRRKIKKCDSGDVFHKSKKKCVDAESYEC